MIRNPLLHAAPLALILIAAPLAFGAVAPAAARTLALVLFALLAATLFVAREVPLERPVLALAAVPVAVAAIGLLQLVELPGALARFVAPEHARISQANLAIEARDHDRVSLTLDRDATRSTIWTLLAVSAALLTASVAGASSRSRRLLFGGLLASALLQIGLGFAFWLTRSESLWGVRLPYTPRLRGSFVNPNHTALLLECAFAAACGWLFVALVRARRRSSLDGRLAELAPATLVWLLLFVGLGATGSRAGLLAALAAGATGLALALNGMRAAAFGLTAGGIGVAAIAALTWNPQAGFGRLVGLFSDRSAPLRVESMAAAARLWAEFPLFGSGLGSFRAAYPLVAERDLGGELWHAHSDWLELGATAGLIGFLTVAAGFLVALRSLHARFVMAERTEARGAALAALIALVAVALHELVDFGLTMPANALALATLVGVALARPRPAAAETPSG